MNESPFPVLDLFVLCESVEFDEQDSVNKLVHPIHSAALEANPDGSLQAPDWELYFQLNDENATGTFHFIIEVRDENDQPVQFGRSLPITVVFQSHYLPITPFEHVLEVSGLVLPSPGTYHLHMLGCRAGASSEPEELQEYLSMHDFAGAVLPAKVRVIRAELPGA